MDRILTDVLELAELERRSWDDRLADLELAGVPLAVFGTATVVTNSGKAIAAKRHLGASPAQAEPKFIGIGTGATGAARTAVAADTALSTEVETRATGTGTTVTVTNTNDAYQTTGSITATATRAVDEMGTFDASTTGNMDVSATFAVVNLASGDTFTPTVKKQFT